MKKGAHEGMCPGSMKVIVYRLGLDYLITVMSTNGGIFFSHVKQVQKLAVSR